MSKPQTPPKLRLVEETRPAAQCPQAYTVRPTEILPPNLPRRESYGARPSRGAAIPPLAPPVSDDVALHTSTPGFELVDCFEIIDSVLELLFIPAGFKIGLALDSAPFLAARTPLESILYEILDNAIAHHDHGRGQIHIALAAQECCHRFTVWDDGPGIPADLYDDLAALNDETAALSDEIGGLRLCARLAAKHGAKLDLEVRPGQRGTMVRLSWPHFEWDYQWRKHS